MSRCDICNKRLTRSEEVLCRGCREAIVRLRVICEKKPELLGGTTAEPVLEMETESATADHPAPSEISAHGDQ